MNSADRQYSPSRSLFTSPPVELAHEQATGKTVPLIHPDRMAYLRACVELAERLVSAKRSLAYTANFFNHATRRAKQSNLPPIHVYETNEDDARIITGITELLRVRRPQIVSSEIITADGKTSGMELFRVYIRHDITESGGVAYEGRHLSERSMDMYMSHVLYGGVVISHELQHWLRMNLPPELGVPFETPPKVRADYGKGRPHSTRVEDPWMTGEGGWAWEAVVFGGRVSGVLVDSRTRRFKGQIERNDLIGMMTPTLGFYFMIPTRKVSEIVTGSRGWERALPFAFNDDPSWWLKDDQGVPRTRRQAEAHVITPDQAGQTERLIGSCGYDG